MTMIARSKRMIARRRMVTIVMIPRRKATIPRVVKTRIQNLLTKKTMVNLQRPTRKMRIPRKMIPRRTTRRKKMERMIKRMMVKTLETQRIQRTLKRVINLMINKITNPPKTKRMINHRMISLKKKTKKLIKTRMTKQQDKMINKQIRQKTSRKVMASRLDPFQILLQCLVSH